MNQSLKDFMSEHRQDFDEELPSLHNWNAIETRMKGNTGKKSRRQMYWAAAAILLFATSLAFILINPRATRVGDKDYVLDPELPEEFQQWPAEFAAKAKTYYSVIEERQKSLQQLASRQPELASQFQGDMAALDSAYQILNRQARQMPGSEVIIKAMIQNLQLQAELLNKQLQIISEYSNHKKDSHEEEKNNSRSI